MAKKNDKGLIFAVSFSSAAISASLVFFGMQTANQGISGLSETELRAEIFEGIEAYIEKQEEEYEEQTAAAEEIPQFPELDFDFWEDDATQGSEDAPVLIVEFSDYECYYCQKFYSETLTKIRENYIDTGKVRFMYRDYPASSHKNAYPAALISECSRDQGGDTAYFQVHDYIFENGYNYDSIVAYAGTIGLSTAELKTCFEDDKFADEIAKDKSDASNLILPAELAAGRGIGTPTFVINGKRVRGAYPYETFEQLIEEALEESA